MSRVQVVLFVKGRGCDSDSFRPRRDETQWWNRRDALVRCMASFLFGPHSELIEKGLVLLFDEDWSRIHVELSENSSEQQRQSYVPTEQHLIGLLKRASESVPGTRVMDQGLQATLSLSADMSMTNLPASLDSKRAILEYLQEKCEIDFLRQHGLNSSAGAILKKSNRQKLAAVWRAWVERSDRLKQSNIKDSLTPILEDILCAKQKGNIVKKTIAGILHESGNAELPVWGQKPDASSEYHVTLFLGAVRDMQRDENACLASVCREKKIPLVKMRLSRVPEFTSKILTMVAFHAANGVLWPAMQSLCAQDNKEDHRKRPRCTLSSQSPHHRLEVVCFVSLPPQEVVTDLNKRSRLLWNIVRCSVVTLWRSKIHAGQADCPLTNRLHLVFEGGTLLTLEQEELVSYLAEQHQAAPCEFQILSAIRERVLAGEEKSSSGACNVDWSEATKSLAKKIRRDTVGSLTVISIDSKSNDSFVKNFYKSDLLDKSSETYVLLQTLDSPTASSESFMRAMLSYLAKKKKSSIVTGTFTTSCVDATAAAITFMQHVAYQGRVGQTLVVSDQGKKQK